MNKDKIRGSFKYSILKSLLLRVDYSNLIDSDIDDFIKVVKKEMFNHGYSSLREGYQNNIDFNITILNNSQNNIQNSVETKNNSIKVYTFESEEGSIVSISKSFIIFQIDVNTNKTLFSNFIDLMSFLLNNLKKFEFIRFQRIGLRKVNSCILMNKELLNIYFNSNVFCRFDNESPRTNIADELKRNEISVNYNRSFQEGTIVDNNEEISAYQIILDIDSYIEDGSVIQPYIFENKSRVLLKELNDVVYDIYFDSLSEKFVNDLLKDDFDDSEIKGVIKNE